MKKLAYYFSAALLGATVLFSSCKKKTEDPTPTVEGKTYTATMTSTNNGTQTVDATATYADGTAKIRLDVSGTNNMDQIFVMLSRDNGPFEALTIPTITNAAGQTFTGGSSNYSLNVPNLKSFILDIPISIRTAGTVDVYQIWITNGSGAFNKPTKNRDLGIANVIIRYTASTAATFATATVTLGDQAAVEGSLLVTSGQIAALLTADYNDAPESSDLALCALNAGGTSKTNGSGILWLVSPDVRASLGYATEPANPNTSYISAYAGTDFATITAAQLAALSVGTGQKVEIAALGVYAFQTEGGKKGLIKVNSISGTTNKSASVTVKVLN